MSTPNLLIGTLRQYGRAFRDHLWLWLGPTIAFTVAATAYALVKTPSWQASQALVVRDEAIGNLQPQGRFDSSETMRAYQETILEVARSRVVVLGALSHLGPPSKRRSTKPWPTDAEIEELQQHISISAPSGAEFGSTEVIYLSVVGSTPEEAIARTSAVCDQLESRLSGLRNAKAASVLTELDETLSLALGDLEEATSRLEIMESEVGSDLGELRILNDSGAGDSSLRRALNQLKTELRQVTTAHASNQQLRELLRAAKDDPDQLLATPSRMLETQATLRRLKEGLVDAQLRTSTLRGRMSDNHPSVVAALGNEDEVRQNILTEIASALRGLATDLQVSQQQVGSLERQHDELQVRLDRLANLRARYSNLVDDVRQRTAIVNQAKQELADARAGQSAAQSTSLLTRFHAPVSGDRPLGPGRKKIVLGGFFGGLLSGAGLIFLLVLPADGTMPTNRRWSDLIQFGRRANDPPPTTSPVESCSLAGGRRASDRSAPPENALTPVDPRRSCGHRISDQEG